MFFEDLAGAVESVLEPKTGSGKAKSGGSCDAIVDGVAFLEAEDSRGFDANVLIGREAGDEFAGGVGDGAGEEFGGAAGGVTDTDEWNFDLLEGAVIFEIEMSEFARAEEIVYADDGVDFFAGVAVGVDADTGFEELDLEGELGIVAGGGPERRLLRSAEDGEERDS